MQLQPQVAQHHHAVLMAANFLAARRTGGAVSVMLPPRGLERLAIPPPPLPVVCPRLYASIKKKGAAKLLHVIPPCAIDSTRIAQRLESMSRTQTIAPLAKMRQKLTAGPFLHYKIQTEGKRSDSHGRRATSWRLQTTTNNHSYKLRNENLRLYFLVSLSLCSSEST